jgi:hypothetical protein
MANLIAKRDILFDGKNYKSGEKLPTYNADMLKLWLELGSALWDEDKTDKVEVKENTDTEEVKPTKRKKV